MRKAIGLELDDIQSGALHERPSPYVGTYLLLRIDDRAAGRELVRRLHSVVDSGRPSSDPNDDTWITAAFTYQGLKALGVPQTSLDSFAPEFRQGMAARAAELGDVGDSSPLHWEKPLGTGDVHVALAALSPDPARLRVVAREGAPRPARPPRCRADLASGLLPARDRTHLVRLQGRDRPAGRRGQRHTSDEPEGAAAEGGRDHPRLPGRDRRAAADADTGRARAETAPTSSSANCTPGWRRTGSTCAPRPTSREAEALLGAKMVGRWQSGAPLDARSRTGRSRPRRRPTPQQRLRLRRRSRVASSVRPAPTRAAPTRGTPWTTTAVSTFAFTA